MATKKKFDFSFSTGGMEFNVTPKEDHSSAPDKSVNDAMAELLSERVRAKMEAMDAAMEGMTGKGSRKRFKAKKAYTMAKSELDSLLNVMPSVMQANETDDTLSDLKGSGFSAEESAGLVFANKEPARTEADRAAKKAVAQADAEFQSSVDNLADSFMASDKTLTPEAANEKANTLLVEGQQAAVQKLQAEAGLLEEQATALANPGEKPAELTPDQRKRLEMLGEKMGLHQGLGDAAATRDPGVLAIYRNAGMKSADANSKTSAARKKLADYYGTESINSMNLEMGMGEEGFAPMQQSIRSLNIRNEDGSRVTPEQFRSKWNSEVLRELGVTSAYDYATEMAVGLVSGRLTLAALPRSLAFFLNSDMSTVTSIDQIDDDLFAEIVASIRESLAPLTEYATERGIFLKGAGAEMLDDDPVIDGFIAIVRDHIKMLLKPYGGGRKTGRKRGRDRFEVYNEFRVETSKHQDFSEPVETLEPGMRAVADFGGKLDDLVQRGLGKLGKKK